MLPSAIKLIAASTLLAAVSSTFAVQSQYTASSGATITPVVEFHTSEGGSSCPPADKWA